MSNLATLVGGLAQARADVKDWQERVKATKDLIAATELGEQLAACEQSLADAKAAESQVRDEVEKAAFYDYDGSNKHPHPAITIKDFTMYEYDPALARNWAMIEMPALLELNVKKFEQVIGKIGAPDFVTTSVDHRVTVSTDLSGYLG